MSPRRLTWRLPALALLGALALFVILPARTEAQSMSGFGASGSAFGARVSVTISKAPLVPNIIDAGGPLAQTTLDSLGTTGALAAFPYPGDVALNLPGLIAGLGPSAPQLVSGIPNLIGANVPGLPPEVLGLLAQIELPGELVEPIVANAPALPPYPFAAKADDLVPHAEVDLGVGKLTADAAPAKVTASATAGPGASGVTLAPLDARSSITQADDGSVLVEATGSISGLRVGPIVIGAVTSTARMVRSADGVVTPTSSFRASGIQLGAISVDLTSDGFVIADTPVPAPIADTINGVLASIGIEMRLLPSVVTSSGVVAGGLELVRPQDFGPLGTGSISVILGQSSARLDSGSTGPTSAAPVAEASTDVVGAPVVGGFTELPSALGGVAAPSTPSASREGAVVLTRGSSPAEIFDVKGLYLLLILSAAVIVGIGPLPARDPVTGTPSI